MFADDPILPPPPDDCEVLHDREYRVRAFRRASDRILIQGAVRDQKPPDLYIADDPDPLTIHHMQVSLEIDFPSLEIVDVTVHFEMHPMDSCPTITEHYGNVIGLSIARGFTHRVRDLFGGPRGCTHTTALLQAMAPVAMQCFWSMRSVEAKLAGRPRTLFDSVGQGEDNENWRLIVGSCHVWAPDGELVAEREAGAPPELPVFLRDRVHPVSDTT